MAISVSPAKLEFNIKKGEAASQKIFLQNLETNLTKVSLTLSDTKYTKQIYMNPAELILPPSDIQEAEIKVSSKKNLNTEIQIAELAKTQGELAVTSGVRIPLSVKVENSFSLWTFLLPLLLATAATGTVFYFKKRKFKRA